MEEPRDDATTGDDVSYSYKSSVIGAPFEFQLTSDALHWGKGGSRGRTPYRQIRRVRLGFRPMTMQNYRFITEIWTDGPKLTIASTSWKSMVEHERLDASYRAFVAELCRRIGAAGGGAVFLTGPAPPFSSVGGVGFFCGRVARARLSFRPLPP